MPDSMDHNDQEVDPRLVAASARRMRLLRAESDHAQKGGTSRLLLAPALRDRVGDQAAAHWREFALITASGGVLLVIGAAGLLLTRSIAFDALVVLLGLMFVTVAAFVLAYFSMNVGALTISGPITAQDVVTSFLIAASQLAMPLWIGNVLRQHERIDGIAPLLTGVRHWFGLFACFALSAAYANAYGATRRRRSNLASFESYELAQRSDRRGAFCCGLLAMASWGSMLWWHPAPPVLALLLIAFATGVVKAIVNQTNTVADLMTNLDEGQ